MEGKEWIYIGIFLTDSSRKKLKKTFHLPDGWKEFYDHMTVVFNDGSDVAKAIKSINKDNLGRKFKLKVSGIGISEKAYAARVELPTGVVCANKITHITMGCSETGKAVDSNYIENWSSLHENIYVTGEMRVYTPDANLFLTGISSVADVDEANVMF